MPGSDYEDCGPDEATELSAQVSLLEEELADARDALFTASWQRMVLLAVVEKQARKFGDFALDIEEAKIKSQDMAYKGFDELTDVRRAVNG